MTIPPDRNARIDSLSRSNYIELSAAAAEDLDRLIRTHSLPPDTRERIQHSLRSLARFPRLGAELGGRWSGFRFLLGPWRWMILVYALLEEDGRVVVVTTQDGRSSRAPSS